MSYLGVPPFGQTLRSVEEHTATEGQTVFSVNGGYYPTFIDVVLNGVELYSGDFTATNGTEVVLATGASAGDELKTTVYWPVSLIDSYRKSEVDALLEGTGGGATGGGNDEVFIENDKLVTTSYTITAGKNAMTAGPISINTGVSATVPSGSVWTII